MIFTKRGTIKYKLTAMVMLITVSSLFLVSIVFISIDQNTASSAMSSRITTLARVISSRITAAIMFDDQDAAELMLSALKQDNSISIACAYTASGEIVAQYSKSGNVKCPSKNRGAFSNPRNDHLELFQPISLNEENLGTLYISASYKELNDRLVWFVLIALVVTLFASVFAFFAVLSLQQYITAPLIKLRDITDNISKRGDYSQTLPNAGNDEIGSLCRSFALMIEQIQIREAEREKAENTLMQSEVRFRALVQNAPVGICELDLEGYLASMNPSGLKMMQLSNESIISGIRYLDLVCEEERSEITTLLSEVLDGQTVFFEFKTASVDGSLFSSSLVPIKDELGHVQRLMGISVDITKNKTNEIALRRAQKMEAVGQLTGGIAHDFNNILGIIIGNLQLLEMTVEGNEKALGRIKKALKGAQRGADITRRLLKFSRNETHGTKKIDVSNIINNIGELVAKSLTVSINVKTIFSEDLWLVNVDPGDMEDAILNLSLNAKDAMPAGGTLIIEVSNKALDDNYVKCNPESKSGDFVMISVSDDGMGMSDETKSKALEPFFTTKEQGKGTGLGLSMVYGFVQRSGGHIKIYSELDEGTTFHIFLPRAQDNKKTGDKNEGLFTELPRGTETILIVDDEDALLDIAAEYLIPLGYSILTASHAKEALKIVEDNRNIDLVFSDIIMPGGIDGYQLAEIVHQQHPIYKILLASGFTKKREDMIDNENEYLLKLTKSRLHKPYNQSELAIAIRKALDD